MHPWGCEAETSIQELFGYFTRCLQHGEWELAGACVPQLMDSPGGLSEQLQEIVKAIVTYPYLLKWENVGSPHRLAWLWLQVLEKWTKEQVPLAVRRELEFLLLLEELGDEVPETVIKELHQAFLEAQSKRKAAGVSGTANAVGGAGVESCLEALLENKRPRLAQALANALEAPSLEGGTGNQALQQTFVRHLAGRVGKLGLERMEGWAEEMATVLAVMPWRADSSGGHLEALCEALWAARDGPLCEERVLSALLRPHCHAALSLYCSTTLRLRRDRLLRDTPSTQVDLPEAEKLLLSLCCHGDRPSVWKTIYFECLSSGKHFLEQVLVTALDLVKREEFVRLEELLKGEFQPLSRLLLLLAWTQCQSLESAQNLLRMLHHDQALVNDSILKEFANSLSSQLGVLEWCAENNPGISTEALLAQLHTLDNHSALYVLHSLTPLAQVEECRVLDLLQELPQHSGAEGPRSPTVQRNMLLFQGFCAMKYALYALCVNAHKYSNCSDCETMKQQHSEAKGDHSPALPASPEGCSPLYQHYLSECQLHLEAVPVMFRLELLENLFSLLFLSNADFAQNRKTETNARLDTAQTETPPGSRRREPEVARGTANTGDEGSAKEKRQPDCAAAAAQRCSLDLGHFTQGCQGFLLDVTAMEGFLRLLKEGLEGVCVVGHQAGREQAELAESLGCSVTEETFGPRLQRLSKRTAEAQWRLQIIIKNQGSSAPDRPVQAPLLARPPPSLKRGGSSSSSTPRRRKRRHAVDKQPSGERHNGGASASTSDGGGAGGGESEVCPCGGPHSWLVPAMLSPPESLLVACIRRGNFMEAHHVASMFGLEASACYGELVFMERYGEVLVELGRVEQTIETQHPAPSESLGVPATQTAGRSRGGSGRCTLQAIGSAAAAGMAFYSISDVAERLLSTPGHTMASLEEGYWMTSCHPEPCGLLRPLLEELSPAAMAAFDVACCHCQRWKTSRQLLDTAERRLNSSLEIRGLRVDPKTSHSEGIRGFPLVLQQISRILSHAASAKGSAKTDGAGDDQVGVDPFGCSIQEVLLCCHPELWEERIAAGLGLAQRLELSLHTLTSAIDTTAECRMGGALLAALLEQASLKPSELDAHPVRSHMKQLLRSLDQHCPFQPDGVSFRPDYMRSFLDYVNTLASVLVRSLGPEDQSAEVKLGNPLLVLLQSPTQLLSHLLFERQVSPDRVDGLLRQEGLGLSVQQVVVQRCCESLPVWDPCAAPGTDQADQVFGVAGLAAQLEHRAQDHLPRLGVAESPSEPSSESDASLEEILATSTNLSTTPPSPHTSSSSTSSSSSASSFLLTPSALSFLRTHSPLLAALACLSASRGGASARAAASGWSGLSSYFGGRKEAVLDAEQISREGESLLKDFPILRAYLRTMAQPVLAEPLGAGEDELDGGAGLGVALCGKPQVGLLLSGPQGASAQAVAAEAFQQALAARDLGRALSLLELYQSYDQEGALRDCLLACAAREDGDGGIAQLFRVRDPSLRARVALEALERWPLDACLELLEFCLNDSEVEAAPRAELEQRKKELDIYHWILNLQPSLPWVTWQEVRSESRRDPESVLALMLEAREFALCAQWVALYRVSDRQRLQLQTEHLLHLLDKGQMDDAFQLLESLSDFAVGLEVCERALDRRPGLSACHFLADYLTLHFQSQVSPARRRHIHALHLGSKVLLTLPPVARQDYFPLLSDPLLMLEQLLMNLKVDWVHVAVRTLQSLLVGQEAGFGSEDIDELLSKYACKALDFPYAPRKASRSDSILSLQDALFNCLGQESCPPSPRVESSASSSGGSAPIHTSSSSDRGKDQNSTGKRSRSPALYQPPDKPPARKDWIPDTQQHICMVCKRERFTMFNRRHHCRRCGRLVCHACSGHKMVVEGGPVEEVRVCDQCYSFFHPDSDDELEQAEAAGSPLALEGDLDGLLHLPEVLQKQFRLSADPAENLQLESEFYYEQAPSASLSVAILSLHSDQTACGHQLIDHCRTLSRKLTNPEVDARLLTDVMRQLLFSAKLMFVKVGRSQDLALCDSYISKVDVLKILVTANYKYIPSLDDIVESAAVTRLRNQLLETEYYQLAVEVSTKSGLDPSGVWQAWGMACLKAGNLFGAREKLGRCLKAPLDRNQLNLGPRLLQEVVQHLESTVRPTPASSSGEDILASLRELEEALCEAGPVDWSEAQAQRSHHHQEALYYLHSYGTHLALVSFYMRHDCMKEALTHLLSKDCPEEVFLEGVLQPSLERGRLGMLQTMLETLDPGLDGCSRYLLASCQQLQRKGHFHTLYQLQQFMMDHVRAAMTCIRFFSHGAQTYLQLGEQQRWLVRAKEHLKTYLQEQQGRVAGRRKSLVNSFRKKMSSSDVSRHMNTIELQLEVTRFLHRCEASDSSKAAEPGAAASNSSGSSSPGPPTLFGLSPMKIDVACKVLLGGKNIVDGFGIAYRVIQDFQLEALAVYVRAGQRLARQRQYKAVRQLLKCVGESGTATKNDCDAIVLSCVSVADKGPADAKELESLVLEIKNPENKIKALLQCSKLRAAYLQAVKLEAGRAGQHVQEVLQASENTGDAVMQGICRQWLSEHQDKTPPTQRQARPNAR